MDKQLFPILPCRVNFTHTYVWHRLSYLSNKIIIIIKVQNINRSITKVYAKRIFHFSVYTLTFENNYIPFFNEQWRKSLIHIDIKWNWWKNHSKYFISILYSIQYLYSSESAGHPQGEQAVGQAQEAEALPLTQGPLHQCTWCQAIPW